MNTSFTAGGRSFSFKHVLHSLQLFLTAGVVHTLATDSIAMHRFQVSTFGCFMIWFSDDLFCDFCQIAVFAAVALVLAVIIVDDTIYANAPSLSATGAGWMLIAAADVSCFFPIRGRT